MEAEGKSTVKAAVLARRSRRLWLWFVSGFLLVFIGTLLLATTTAMHPSGQHAERYPLWRYYAVALPRLLGPTTLGPASGGTSPLTVGLFHVLISAAGGGAAAVLGWWARRLRSQPPCITI
jgi:hypothetical protein